MGPIRVTLLHCGQFTSEDKQKGVRYDMSARHGISSCHCLSECKERVPDKSLESLGL